MRVAYYSPLSPQRSGIADYSALLPPALERRVDVVLARPNRSHPSADVALYQLGNDPEWHGWIYNALRRRPGVVVLHEVALHGLISGLTLGRGDREGYLAAVERDGGVEARLQAERALAGLEPPLWEAQPDRFPLIREALDFARAWSSTPHTPRARCVRPGMRGRCTGLRTRLPRAKVTRVHSFRPGARR
jgi:hypothetical protein